MLVRLSEVQNAAANHLKSRRLVPTDASHAPAGASLDWWQSIRFYDSPDAKKRACWHAQQILLAVRSLQHNQGYRETSEGAKVTEFDSSTLSLDDRVHRVHIAPHFAHCVTSAVLTLWALAFAAKDPTTSSPEHWLLEGSRLLSGTSVSSNIQVKYKTILIDLLQVAR
jgi:hypothetical protein